MRLRLPSGLQIAAPPLFYWERRRNDLLRIRTARSFHPCHATTLLCLELLEETIRNGGCERLLDVGCGSGILALAGVFMGVDIAVGIDVSIRAVRESILNAELNNLATKTLWAVGSTELLEDLVRLTSTDEGSLILSGFHDIEWSALEERCRALGMRTERILSKDRSFYGIPPSGSFTWFAVRLRRGT
jgi:SAM-dependent methyltransferase